jgi:hypothetical protein
MQAARIKIGDTYAVRHGGKMVRFVVREIKTVSIKTGRKADTTNHITGTIPEADLPGTAEERTKTFMPEEIEGPYSDYLDLKAKQEEETRLKEEQQAREKANRERLQAILYEISGITRPPEVKTSVFSYRSEPIQVSYQGVIITAEVVAILIEKLEELQKKACFPESAIS